MYRLLVYYPEQTGIHATIHVDRSADVLTRIPQLLAEHDGCERVVVMFNDTRLFAVDCEGNRLP